MSRLTAWAAALLLPLCALTGCGSAAEPPLPSKIEAVFTEAHADGFNGSVLVTRGDAVLYQGSFGLADDQARVANGAATKFPAMSLNKPVTAVLVFQQIEAGKLRLDQKLDSLFANLVGKPAGAITIGQLLSHTSGIEEVISAHRDRRITPADLEGARIHDAGEVAYSSTGFVCLALVLEAVSGRHYSELVRERIFEPAGMHDSGLLQSGVVVDGLAKGYRETNGAREEHGLDIAPEVMEGAGSMYTTTGDLAKFDQALYSGKLLSPATQKTMYSRVTDERSYGWSLGEQGGQYFPWHKGSYRGFTAVFVRQIQRHEMIAILSNDRDADVLGLRKQVLQLLKKEPGAAQ